jgi:hypothetical protein
MHNSILLGLWAGVSFVLYKIVSSIILSRRHAADPSKQAWWDPLGIVNVAQIIKADKEYRIPQYLKSRVDLHCEEAGKIHSTFWASIMVSPECTT